LVDAIDVADQFKVVGYSPLIVFGLGCLRASGGRGSDLDDCVHGGKKRRVAARASRSVLAGVMKQHHEPLIGSPKARSKKKTQSVRYDIFADQPGRIGKAESSAKIQATFAVYPGRKRPRHRVVWSQSTRMCSYGTLPSQLRQMTELPCQ
jgi:hypothetical protein